MAKTIKDKVTNSLNLIRLGLPEYEALELCGLTESQIEKTLLDDKFQKDVNIVKSSAIARNNEAIAEIANDMRPNVRSTTLKAILHWNEELRPDLYRRDLQNTKLSASMEKQRAADNTGIHIEI